MKGSNPPAQSDLQPTESLRAVVTPREPIRRKQSPPLRPAAPSSQPKNKVSAVYVHVHVLFKLSHGGNLTIFSHSHFPIIPPPTHPLTLSLTSIRRRRKPQPLPSPLPPPPPLLTHLTSEEWTLSWPRHCWMSYSRRTPTSPGMISVLEGNLSTQVFSSSENRCF